MATYFLQTVPDIVDKNLSLKEKLKATVNNTGNYFFEFAVKNQLSNFFCINRLDEIPDSCEKLILSMSNFLSPYTDLGFIADKLIEKRVKQVVMIGAGAQANSYNEKIKLTKGTEKFLNVIAELSITIGARGYFTEHIMNDYGVKNVEVIGCPSIFLHKDRSFVLNTKQLPAKPKVAVHYTPTGHYRDNISHINNFAVQHATTYVAQSELDLVEMYENTDVQYMFKYYNNGKFSPVELKKWFLEHTSWFFDMKTWMDFMRQLDFSVGTRFHGNMSAIQAGVPALNLTFDTRTRELCEYLNLPTYPLHKFNSNSTLEELYSLSDYSLFNQTYSTRYDKYANFLSRNGVEHSLGAKVSADNELSAKIAANNLENLLATVDIDAIPQETFLRYVKDLMEPTRSLEMRKKAEAGHYQ
tara:strand:+ start:3157 stop:4395 length:1239 start_codon:yes stop_codon:yes gene_type:complete